MKFTDSKDSVKVNQILPILKEHFGNNINLARIKLMSMMIHALCVVQTVSIHKLAVGMPSEVGRDSNMRRQRFLAKYVLDLDIIAKMKFSLLPAKTGLALSMDRTNWKFGKFDINILMLGVTYKEITFPLLFKLMPKRGNSNCEERQELVERFIKLFGQDCIDFLVANREFVGQDWIGWLNENNIRYYIRIRQNFWIINPRSDQEVRTWHLFNRLRVGEELFYHKLYIHKGQYVYIAGAKLLDSEGKPELQILICYNQPQQAVKTYKQRWQIETLFRAMKSSGFDMDVTHLRDMERITRLVAMVCVALV